MFSQDQQQQWIDENRAAVQEQLSEPVVSFMLFYRTGSWGQMGLEYLPGFGSLIAKMIGRSKAGGLPPRFLLVITPAHIYAYGYKQRGTKMRVGKQLRTWNRSQVQVSAKDTTLTKRVTIEPVGGEDGAVVVDTGKSWATDHFLEQLAPVALAA